MMIIILSETGLSLLIKDDEQSVQGMTLIMCGSENNKGGGIVIYARSHSRGIISNNFDRVNSKESN